MKPAPNRCLHAAALITVAALLAACGGGGTPASTASVTIGNGAAGGATEPVLTLTPTHARTFRFTWPDMADETEYRLLEDPTGSAGYTQVATPTANTTQHDLEVFLPGRINARYILQACKAGVCVDSAPVNVTGDLAQAIGMLKADGPGEYDEFGFSVAMSDDGDTLVIGAPGEDSDHAGIALVEPAGAGEALDSGAVYVFTRQGQAWQQQAFVKASVPLAGSAFGRSVALSANGDTLAVGAQYEDNAGAVYVFARQGNTWVQQQHVQPDVRTQNGEFGGSVALSSLGQVLVVGDTHENSVVIGSGATYVFTFDGVVWSERALLKAANPQAHSQFGFSVSIDGAGSTIAVGAPDDSADVQWGGAVHVFTGSGSNWGVPMRLVPAQPVAEQSMGQAVALSRDGSTLVAGAPIDTSSAAGIGGDPLAGGSYGSGAVHVFARDGGTNWTYQAYIKASNPDEDDRFGRSLALSGNGDTLVVGAPYERSTVNGINGDQGNNGAPQVGAAYLFQRQGLDWRQQAYLKAPNSGGGDEFGKGLALSADGQRLFVGAPGESTANGGWNPARDNNSVRSGAAYLY